MDTPVLQQSGNPPVRKANENISVVISISNFRSITSRFIINTEVFREVSIVSVISAIFIKRAFTIVNFVVSRGHKTESFPSNHNAATRSS